MYFLTGLCDIAMSTMKMCLLVQKITFYRLIGDKSTVVDPLLVKLIFNCLFTTVIYFLVFCVVRGYSRCILCFNPDDTLSSFQVRLRVWRPWFGPEWGPLQSWAVVSHLPVLPKKPPPQTCSHFMLWSGCVLVTTSPSSSNLEYTLLVFIPTIRVSIIHT